MLAPYNLLVALHIIIPTLQQVSLPADEWSTMFSYIMAADISPLRHALGSPIQRAPPVYEDTARSLQARTRHSSFMTGRFQHAPPEPDRSRTPYPQQGTRGVFRAPPCSDLLNCIMGLPSCEIQILQ